MSPVASGVTTNARVIKPAADSLRPLFPISRVMSAELFDSETLISNARREAAQLLEEAHREIESMRADAARESEESRRIGYEEGRLEIHELLEITRRGIGEFETVLKQRLTQTAIDLAAAVLEAELRISAEAVMELARAALARARLYGSATLVMHPDQYAIAAQEFDAISRDMDERAPLAIRQDETVRPGCLRIETDMGQFEVSPFERLPLAAETFSSNGEAR